MRGTVHFCVWWSVITHAVMAAATLVVVLACRLRVGGRSNATTPRAKTVHTSGHISGCVVAGDACFVLVSILSRVAVAG